VPLNLAPPFFRIRAPAFSRPALLPVPTKWAPADHPRRPRVARGSLVYRRGGAGAPVRPPPVPRRKKSETVGGVRPDSGPLCNYSRRGSVRPAQQREYANPAFLDSRKTAGFRPGTSALNVIIQTVRAPRKPPGLHPRAPTCKIDASEKIRIQRLGAFRCSWATDLSPSSAVGETERGFPPAQPLSRNRPSVRRRVLLSRSWGWRPCPFGSKLMRRFARLSPHLAPYVRFLSPPTRPRVSLLDR